MKAACKADSCYDMHNQYSSLYTPHVLRRNRQPNDPPDMFVVVEYGEHLGDKGDKIIGRLGQTDVVDNKNVADFGHEDIRYSKSEETHEFKIRENGYYEISLMDKMLFASQVFGYTIVNVSDVGKHKNVAVGDGKVSFEVYAGKLLPLSVSRREHERD